VPGRALVLVAADDAMAAAWIALAPDRSRLPDVCAHQVGAARTEMSG
jgi:hypothetical protein